MKAMRHHDRDERSAPGGAQHLARPHEPHRVLMTLDSVGGVARYALDLARGLGAHGVDCLLVGFGPGPTRALVEACRTIERAELVWTAEPLDWLAEDERACRSYVPALLGLAHRWRADVLHLNAPAQAADLPLGLPVVVTAHSCTPTWWEAVKGTPLPQEWQWQKARNRRGFARAERVIVPSLGHAEAVSRIYGPIDGLRIVHNATRLHQRLRGDEPFVLAAGRWWDEGKNGRTLDEAAASTPWPVVLAGPLEGPDGQRLTLSHAHPLGELPPEALHEAMRRAPIFVAPSRYEPFGLAVLEAAASGAALVLADIPTFRHLWRDAALFVAPDDAAGFAAAIGTLADDAALRRRLAARAQHLAQTFTLERQVAATLELHREALTLSFPTARAV